MEFSLLGIVFVILEFLRPLLPALTAIAALEAVLLAWLLVGRRRARVRPALGGAVTAGGLAAVAIALWLPAWTQASLADLRSAVDFLALGAAAAGGGATVALLLYPPLQILLREPDPAHDDR